MLCLQGSITSADLVTYVLRKERIDTIMHFAAQTHVDNSFGNSIAFTETNILGTHVLLEAAKEARVKLFVHVSTDEVYGDGIAGVASHEGSVLEPTNPYSATKAGAEYLVKAYHRSFALPIIITRGNNVYGPHQYPEKIIPKFVNQLMRGLPLTLHGDGSNTRNYLYVEDVAAAFDVILHRGVVGEIYNMGGVNEISNLEVARAMLRLLGVVEGEEGSHSSAGREGVASDHASTSAASASDSAGAAVAPLSIAMPLVDAASASVSGSTEAPPHTPLSASERPFVLLVKDRPFNDLRYPLDCSKLVELGWRESVTWEEGLRRTVAWYLQHSEHWTLGELEHALVAHPRRGLTASEVIRGVPAGEAEEEAEDPIGAFRRKRANSVAASAAAVTAAHCDSDLSLCSPPAPLAVVGIPGAGGGLPAVVGTGGVPLMAPAAAARLAAHILSPIEHPTASRCDGRATSAGDSVQTTSGPCHCCAGGCGAAGSSPAVYYVGVTHTQSAAAKPSSAAAGRVDALPAAAAEVHAEAVASALQ